MSTAAHADPLGAASHDGELLVADSFRVRRAPRTGVAEVRGWELHVERFTGSVLAVLAERERVETNRAAEAFGDPRLFNPLATLESAAFGALLSPERSTPASVLELGREEAERRAELAERVDLAGFIARAAEQIAAHGEGFPRLELRGGGDRPPSLRLALRPLPRLGGAVELRSAPGVVLDAPAIKGPSIARLRELNRQLGAEALLLDAEGRALEGATTSLVWWAPGDGAGFSVAPPSAATREGGPRPADRVGSVTERLVAAAAQQRLGGGEPSRGRSGALSGARLTPDELARHEVWAVNALHGIRPVTSIDGVATPEPDERRLRWFREALDRAWAPVLA